MAAMTSSQLSSETARALAQTEDLNTRMIETSSATVEETNDTLILKLEHEEEIIASLSSKVQTKITDLKTNLERWARSMR